MADMGSWSGLLLKVEKEPKIYFNGNYGWRRMLNESQWKQRYRGLLQHYKLTKQKLDAEREKRIHAFTRFDCEALN